MRWLPGSSEDMVKAATPELKLAVPITVLPSRKVTVPVASEGATVAVNVTGWLKFGLSDVAVNDMDEGVLPIEICCVPLALPSVTFSDCVPGVFNVTVKLWVPLSPRSEEHTS